MRTDAEVLAVEVVRGHLEAYGIPHARQHANHVAAALRDANLLADPNLTAERDRARDIAVALEGQVAAVRALADEWAAHTNDEGLPWAHRVRWTIVLAKIRAALDPDPADRGGVS